MLEVRTRVVGGAEERTEPWLRVSSACLVRIMVAFSRYAGSLSEYFVCGDLKN